MLWGLQTAQHFSWLGGCRVVGRGVMKRTAPQSGKMDPSSPTPQAVGATQGTRLMVLLSSLA